MVPISLTKVLILMLTAESIAGIACRFARTSASQGSCAFPCHCTKGCNQDTGDCINGGQCKYGPSGHLWNGTACQIGNIAYKKATIQRTHLIESKEAVDGNMASCLLIYTQPDELREGTLLTIDLGGEYTIFRVGIYIQSPDYEREMTLLLSIGNSSTTTSTHHGNGLFIIEKRTEGGIAPGRVTRYMSLRIRHVEFNFKLCELFVIGYKHVRCDRCPSTSKCNDVIGCDECPPGKQQPDCTEVQQSQAITAVGVGLAVGTFLLGVLIGGGGIYVACRKRRCKSTPGDTRRKNENVPVDNRTDVLEDEQGHANTAYKREEQEYVNNYDVNTNFTPNIYIYVINKDAHIYLPKFYSPTLSTFGTTSTPVALAVESDRAAFVA